MTTFLFCVPAPRVPSMLGMGDFWKQFGALAHFMDYTIQHGEVPLWNPLSFCGSPFAAHPVTAVFYPLNLLRSALTTHPTHLNAQIGLALLAGFHMLMACVAVFFFARDHKLSYGASLTSGLAYMLSAAMIRRVFAHWEFVAMAAWLPVLLLLLRRCLATSSMRERWCYAAGIGWLLGLSILAGVTQLSCYISFILVAYWLLYRLLRIEPAQGAPGHRMRRMLVGDALVIAGLHVVAILVAAVMLLPAVEFVGFTARAKGTGLLPVDPAFDSSFSSIARYLVVYAGPHHFEPIRAAGAGVVLLALAGAIYARRRPAALFAILFLVLLDCSIGPPLPFATLLEKIVPFSMAEPQRMMILACLPLCMLAGFGVDTATVSLRSPWKNGLRTVLLLIAGAVILAPVAPVVLGQTLLPVSKFALLVPCATLAVMLAAGWVRLPRVWRGLIPVLIVAETLVWNHEFLPYLLTRYPYKGPMDALRVEREFWQDNGRGAALLPNERLCRLEPEINGFDALYIYRVWKVLCAPEFEGTYRRWIDAREVTEANQRGNLFMKRAFWLARQYVNGPLPGKQELFPPTTTAFLQHVPDLPVPQVNLEDLPPHSVSENAKKVLMNAGELSLKHDEMKPHRLTLDLPLFDLPAVHSALCLRYTSTGDAVVKTVFRNPESGRRELGKSCAVGPTQGGGALLEIPLPELDPLQPTITVTVARQDVDVQFTEAFLFCDQADENGRISIVRRTPNFVELEVGELPGYRILTFLDAYYPGWKAYVDCEPAPIYLASDAFKAIVVPPGTHHVRFVFRPWRFYAGLVTTVTASLACIGLLVWTCVAARPSNKKQQ